MDFFELEEYIKKDIDDLIQNEVEESIYLDYKDGRALDSDKIAEITKDVSAFANADGGIIVYGVSENKASHKPEDYAPVTNPKITKEWLEQKISLIRRKIDGVLIFPIRGNTLPALLLPFRSAWICSSTAALPGSAWQNGIFPPKTRNALPV